MDCITIAFMDLCDGLRAGLNVILTEDPTIEQGLHF